MPIEQIKFNLEKLDHKLIAQMSTNLESFIKNMEYLYFYEIENFEIYIEKVYLNRDGEKIKPISFAMSAAACGGVGWRATPTHPGGVDAEVYLERNPAPESPASAPTAPDEGEPSGDER